MQFADGQLSDLPLLNKKVFIGNLYGWLFKNNIYRQLTFKVSFCFVLLYLDIDFLDHQPSRLTCLTIVSQAEVIMCLDRFSYKTNNFG